MLESPESIESDQDYQQPKLKNNLRPTSAQLPKSNLNSTGNAALVRGYQESTFKIKNLNSQLYYMLTENDNLKDEISLLKSQLNTDADPNPNVLNAEIVRLTEERNQALKQTFLCR